MSNVTFVAEWMNTVNTVNTFISTKFKGKTLYYINMVYTLHIWITYPHVSDDKYYQNYI